MGGAYHRYSLAFTIASGISGECALCPGWDHWKSFDLWFWCATPGTPKSKACEWISGILLAWYSRLFKLVENYIRLVQAYVNTFHTLLNRKKTWSDFDTRIQRNYFFFSQSDRSYDVKGISDFHLDFKKKWVQEIKLQHLKCVTYIL